MAGGLAAFFGVPLGGAIFACEVLHRNGLEYHEALVPATISGIACNLVFRVLCSLPETDDAPGCSCCAGLGTMLNSMQQSPQPRGYRLETTSGHGFSSPNHFQSLEGCNDYQLFWD